MSTLRQPGVSAHAIILALLALGGCASTPNTMSNVNPDVDFSLYKTFGFFEPLATDEAGYESLVSSYLKVAMSQQLAKRGLTYANDPDLLINFYINTKDKLRTHTVPSAGMGYYGFRDPFDYDPWPAYPAYETRVTQYTEGTLNVDVVDANGHKLVWEGVVTGRITDYDIKQLEKTVDDAVAAVMAGFPVTAGGS